MLTPLRLALALLCALATTTFAALPPGLLDFSSAGYGGGAAALPIVAAKFAVTPSGGDDTHAIQAALDAAARLPLDAKGFRGAVLLRKGTYQVAGQLKLSASGVVLRGHDATIEAMGESRRTLIQIGGIDDRKLAGGIAIVGDAPAGAHTLTLASIDGFRVGQRIVVRRPSTREWIAALGMTNFPGPGQYKDARLDWVPGSRDIEWERTISAIDGATRTVTLDAPLTTALEAKFGGATVHAFEWPGRVSNVGVENLVCVSAVSADNPLDEEHSWICVGVGAAENVWVRRVTARRFACAAVWIGNQARAVTVTDCASRQPVAENAAWRRLGFYIGGQQVLVQRCTSEEGRHDFSAGHCAAGPIVFLDCRAENAQLDAGPIESWASGVLYDRLTISGAGLSLANIGVKTQGAGWTAANCVVWNCASASKIWTDDPPSAPNKVFVDPTTPSLYPACNRRSRLRSCDPRRSSAGSGTAASLAPTLARERSFCGRWPCAGRRLDEQRAVEGAGHSRART